MQGNSPTLYSVPSPKQIPRNEENSYAKTPIQVGSPNNRRNTKSLVQKFEHLSKSKISESNDTIIINLWFKDPFASEESIPPKEGLYSSKIDSTRRESESGGYAPAMNRSLSPQSVSYDSAIPYYNTDVNKQNPSEKEKTSYLPFAEGRNTECLSYILREYCDS
jgi:hypothetical protein